ncbi:MAG: hypothetical protein EPO24_07720 [Bacteroidetes bacterium]|nr:MAG: hypothetical protein EPO24_07720 [Bacteroidota bacterium]
MYFTSQSPETTPEAKLFNCRNELDALNEVFDTLHRSIESNEDEYYRSDGWLVMLIQNDLEEIKKNISEVQEELYPIGKGDAL